MYYAGPAAALTAPGVPERRTGVRARATARGIAFPGVRHSCSSAVADSLMERKFVSVDS